MVFHKGSGMLRAGATVGLAAVHSFASAQVTVSYAPASTAVPTVSEWGLLIMSGLLAVAAFVAIRKGANSKAIMSLALASMASLGVGGYAVRDVLAQSFPTLAMTNPAGGVITADLGKDPAPISNQTAVPMRVVSITPPAAIDTDPSGCAAGTTVLAPGASCTILVDLINFQ